MNIPNEALIKKNISNENIKYYSKNGFLIAYHHKGIEDLIEPFIRPANVTDIN